MTFLSPDHVSSTAQTFTSTRPLARACARMMFSSRSVGTPEARLGHAIHSAPAGVVNACSRAQRRRSRAWSGQKHRITSYGPGPARRATVTPGGRSSSPNPSGALSRSTALSGAMPSLRAKGVPEYPAIHLYSMPATGPRHGTGRSPSYTENMTELTGTRCARAGQARSSREERAAPAPLSPRPPCGRPSDSVAALLRSRPAASAGAARYTLRIAGDSAEIAAAQRLRHRVFADELGATLHTPVPGWDVDEFDAYRMLPPGRAPRRYSAGEFDLSALAGLDDDLVETGRSCVDGGHRDGAVITLMWAGIARYLRLTGHRWLAGCASVGLADGGTTAAGVWELAVRRHLAPPGYRVLPHRPWAPVERAAGRVTVPPLMRGYLRLGAWVCGAPAYDPDFDCADFFVLLGLDRVDPRYLRHFLGETP